MKLRHPRHRLGGHWLKRSALPALLVLCAIAGGSSRLESLQQGFVWFGSILLSAALLLTLPASAWRPYRPFLIFLGLSAGLVALQLVPLPPAVWTSLPGREPYVAAMMAAGIPIPWHAINLTPDLGWASLLSLIPLFATVAGFAATRSDERSVAFFILIGILVASAILGLVQLGQGPNRAFSFYELVNGDTAVGLFANRNHQATFLALGLPMLALGGRFLARDPRLATFVPWFILVSGLFLFGLILVTGSRAGLLLGLVGIAGAFALARSPDRKGAKGAQEARARRWPRIMFGAAALIGVAVLALFSRNVAFERLVASDPLADQRSQSFGAVVETAKAFFPVGSGFGSFNSVYRAFEPFELLSLYYLNHAHNDLLEIVVEGGLLALLLLLLFLAWWMRAAFRLWGTAPRNPEQRRLGRLGSIITAILMAASLADYPLRTPLMAVIFTIALLWMHCATSKSAVGERSAAGA